MERKPYSVTEAVVRQRTEAATRHGGQSKAQIRPAARAHKRRLLRQMGLHVGDLDGISLALIDAWARAYSKVTVIDEYLSENGIIHNGEVDPALRLYFSGINVSRLALAKLDEHLSRQALPDESLREYIDQQYGTDAG